MNQKQNTTDVWSRVGQTVSRLLGVLLRVLIVLVVAVLLAAAVYFGAPWVYRQLIDPIHANTSQLALLQRQMEVTSTQWVDSFDAQQQRVTSLESQLADQGERIASLEADLVWLDEALAAQQAALDELSLTVDTIANDYASLEEMATLSEEFSSLQENVTFSEQTATQLDALEHRIVLVQIWQEVLKTRLYLVEGNVGDAETTLALALEHLGRAGAVSSEEELEVITTIQAHLTRAASRLREQPIVAAQDLESAWYELGALIAPSQE
jgi:predicted  nucleic acid-binding Zn-ribbon protein